MHLHVDWFCSFLIWRAQNIVIYSHVFFGCIFSVWEILLDIRAPHFESHVVFTCFCLHHFQSDMIRHHWAILQNTDITTYHTVDWWKNPAPVDMVNISLFAGCPTCWVVVWDFFHQQYEHTMLIWRNLNRRVLVEEKPSSIDLIHPDTWLVLNESYWSRITRRCQYPIDSHVNMTKTWDVT